MSRLACVDIPGLPLQILLRCHPEWQRGPAAVVAEDGVQARVHLANREAIRLGVRQGMKQAAAVACCPALRIGHVRPSEVEREISRLAARLHRWSPQVETASTRDFGAAGAFWLRASGLSTLFGPLSCWGNAIREDLAAIGYHASVAVGFSRFGVFAAARAVFGQQVFRSPAAERRAAAAAPLRRFGLPEKTLAELERLGTRTLRDLLRFSRSGLGSRFGPEAARLYRLASEETRALPCRIFRPETPVECRLDFEPPESDLERLLRHAGRMLGQLLAGLRQQGLALAHLDYRLLPEDGSPLSGSVLPALPSTDGKRLLSLLRLRLEADLLAGQRRQPTGRFTVFRLRARGEVRIFEPAGLFGSSRSDPGKASEALARVQAEFGEDSLVRLEIRNAHLPPQPLPLAAGLSGKGGRPQRARTATGRGPPAGGGSPRPTGPGTPHLRPAAGAPSPELGGTRRLAAPGDRTRPGPDLHRPLPAFRRLVAVGQRTVGPPRLFLRPPEARRCLLGVLRSGTALLVPGRPRRVGAGPGLPTALYFPLYCKSNASFLEGASHPEELVEEAHAIGLPGIALTDRNGVYGVVRAHVAARKRGLRLVIGAEVQVAAEAPLRDRRPEEPPESIVLLARDRTGYRNLCRLLTRGLLRGPDPGRPPTRPPEAPPAEAPKDPAGPGNPGGPRAVADDPPDADHPPTTGTPNSRKGTAGVSWNEIAAHAEGLHALWGGGPSALQHEAAPDRPVRLLREAFPNRLHLCLTRHRRATDVPEELRLRELARRYRIPVAAATEVLYHRPGRRQLQDVLTAIRHRVTLDRAGRLLRPNAEHALLSPIRFGDLFADDPAAVARTLEIAADCRFSLDDLRYRYPVEDSGGGPSTELRQAIFRGAAKRYPSGIPGDVVRQLEKELALITELDYSGYFLTMDAIVRFCRERGILCQGRGSAANSAVCYCLGITAVDPVRMGLLFERFLSRERAEPPDIDLDIMHSRREEVIRFVYRKYGAGRAAMVANTVCYRTRSAIRDVGKALGFSERSVDRLARCFSHREALDPDLVRAAGWTPDNPAVGHLMRLVREIQGFPRHLSIHPGGFLLGHEPVSHIVPVENAAMEGRTVIQWNKDDIEELGLFKVDLLGLGALTQLDLCFRLLRRSRGLHLSMATLPADDPETFAMIRKAATVGVFQIESRAQMAMLPRLLPRSYYDLVIQVSIVRPGPIAGGMVHPYLRRRRGEEPVDYPHPSLRPVLARTLGVPLFQEQVMRLAVVAADYTAGEADQLRRDMAAWRRTGRIERHRARLLRRMGNKGIPAEFAERVFEQIRGFGEYGFPESHAASFALISYAGAFLLCHYPSEFVCALLNAQPMGFYTPATIIEDARRRGVRFFPVDAAASEWDCSLWTGALPGGGGRTKATAKPPVRMGLRYVKGLGDADGERILAARRASPFSSIRDFARRTGLGRKALVALAEADAFRSLGVVSRRGAVWEALGASSDHSRKAAGNPRLIREKTPGFAALDDFESIAWDYRASGHSTRGHPLKPLRRRFVAVGLPTAREVSAMRNRARVRYAGMVICRQQPGTASGVVFMTLEDETGFVNLILWPDVFARYRQLARTLSLLGATGRMESQGGAAHLLVESLFRPEIPGAPGKPPALPSRDFH